MATLYHPYQAGGAHGHDPETLLMALEEECPEERFPSFATFDFQTDFNSLDVKLCLEIMKTCKIPPAVLNLLENQWCHQTRWITYAGHVAKRPLHAPQGLP